MEKVAEIATEERKIGDYRQELTDCLVEGSSSIEAQTSIASRRN